MRRNVLAGAFLVAIAVGGMLALSQTETTEAQGPPTFSLPAQAALIAPGVWSLGTAIHNGRVVEGVAIATHKGDDKIHGGPRGGGAGGGGGGGGETPTEANCFSHLFGGAATWLAEPEDYWFNSDGGVGVGDVALTSWETASGAVIFLEGHPTSDILEADTSRGKGPDGQNEIYFAAMKGRGSSGTIAFTILWADTRVGKIVEWDMVFNLNFSWATDGSSNAMDFLNIATHEAGHAAGMGHTDADVALCGAQTMYPTASAGDVNKRSLEIGDTTGIAALYQ
jgi:hypothetical protein